MPNYKKYIGETVVFYKIDSLCNHETLSPDPHFRLIPALLFAFTYARALERREKTKERDGEEAKERKMGNKGLFPAT